MLNCDSDNGTAELFELNCCSEMFPKVQTEIQKQCCRLMIYGQIWIFLNSGSKEEKETDTVHSWELLNVWDLIFLSCCPSLQQHFNMVWNEIVIWWGPWWRDMTLSNGYTTSKKIYFLCTCVLNVAGFFFNLVFSLVSSDYKPLKGAHYRFEQDESLMKSATHSENAIKSI